MRNGDIGRFARRAAFFALPFWVLMASYIALDPFKVIRREACFFKPGENVRIGLNRGYVSTVTFARTLPNHAPDSYILGNSRSLFYEVEDWKRHVGKEARCFHFDASAETIQGIAQKLEYIHDSGAEIRNALLVLDHDTLGRLKPRDGHLFVTPPQLTHHRNLIQFHGAFLKAYADPKFLSFYLRFKLTGRAQSSAIRAHVLDNPPIVYEITSNEVRYEHFEELIKRMPDKYYTPRRLRAFYQRPKTARVGPPAIGTDQRRILFVIRDLLEAHDADHRVVISPLYDQVVLARTDLAFLQATFGADRVHDFSGKNELTEDVHNYYEASHYRPHVAKEVLDAVYSRLPPQGIEGEERSPNEAE